MSKDVFSLSSIINGTTKYRGYFKTLDDVMDSLREELNFCDEGELFYVKHNNAIIHEQRKITEVSS